MLRTSIILKNAREDKDLTLAEVSKKTKIPQKYLEAIETEDRRVFPSEPYCSLMIKDYANFLGLNGEDVVLLFRRDFATRSANNKTVSPQVFLTPQSVFKVGVLVSILIFSFYVFAEYVKYNQSPPLKVSWPEDSNLSLSSKIEVSGNTDPEATVRINNDLIIVDQFGNFKKVIGLSSQDQKVVIESQSHSGKTTTVEKVYHPR